MQWIKNRLNLFLVILIFLSASGCSMAELKLELCWRFSNGDGQILHSSPNPSGTTVIHVVKVDCGQSSIYDEKIYKCSTRLDLEINAANDHRIIPGYESPGVCDAKITWQDDDHFEVNWSNGQKEELDLSEAFSSVFP